MRLSADFSLEALVTRRQWADTLKMLEEKNLSTKNSLSGNTALQIWETEIKPEGSKKETKDTLI